MTGPTWEFLRSCRHKKILEKNCAKKLVAIFFCLYNKTNRASHRVCDTDQTQFKKLARAFLTTNMAAAKKAAPKKKVAVKKVAVKKAVKKAAPKKKVAAKKRA